MTNDEWLKQLAENAPDELAAWFDAEHVENQEQAAEGDTEPENADSRELLDADVRKWCGKYAYQADMVWTWLNRQAAITERECRKPNWSYCETCEALAELTAERDKLQEQLRIGWECECRLQDERDELKRQMDTMRDVTREFRNERERYRSKFGKCLDYADAIHALMDDEGMA